jgi:cytochrome c oxidase subunit III
MNTVAMEQRKKLHPHKFTLWVGIASMLMMFAGFTSALIVKRNLANWITFDLPLAFWYSTAAIVMSSVTLFFASRAFKVRAMIKYKRLLLITILLGVLFIVLQTMGFYQLWRAGVTMQRNVSFAFLWVIVLVHAAHVIGGIIALVVLFAKGFNTTKRNYSTVPVEVTSTYWHFVDVLWIYLLLFLIMIR